jgi:rod shape determining protein RodA
MRRPIYDLTQPGWAIAVSITILVLIGLAAICASNTVPVGGQDVSSVMMAGKQAGVAVACIVLSAVILRIGYMRLSRHAYVFFAICLVLLLPMIIAKYLGFTFGGLVPESRGAYRSIRLPGFSLQPSEFMKVSYILAMAWYLRFRKNYRTIDGLLLPILFSVVPMVLILFEPDLGTVLLFIPVLFGMLYVAGARIKHLGGIILIGLIVAPFTFMKLHAYQKSRIMAVALQSKTFRDKIEENPEKYAFTGVGKREAREWEVSSGMQLVRSKAALGSGGFIGQGWGRGTYVEYNFLPDRHNDFVFAIVGHQWGLLGCLIVLGCYVVIVVAGVEIASVTPEPCGRLLAMGVVCLIAAQTVINVGMTVGLMPITGMTLPFVSYGGSSLMTNFVAATLLISVSQNRPFTLARKPFEWSDRAGAGRA